MNIGKAINTLRLRHKISQKTLAKKVGISQSYLSLIEKGEREPGFEIIKHIADFLNIPQQVIILLACDEKLKDKRFAKPLKKIALLIDDILKSA